MKSKLYFLLGGIFILLAQVATFIIELVFFLMDSYANIFTVIYFIFLLASVVLTICCMVLTLTSKNEKSSYVIVIPTVVIALFLNAGSFYSPLQYLLYFIFRLVLVVGAIFYILGVCTSFRCTQMPKQQEQNHLDQELQKLVAMKNDGLITDEEFDKLKMRIISKGLE